ncbi:N-acetylmuramoyl-L-alanine amidase [Buchnera aphidicola]|uniref:N-acetylmuramoyl-L-alanine amidase n=1 Tax=Buchnera aphidicola TaxID=9 RepID=UPI0034638FA8
MKNKINILIDPGHGGQDPGAIGHKGLKEKEVNLRIAIELEKLLNNNKFFHAILTRNNDSYLSLKNRKIFSNHQHVNLLISIHVDSSKAKYLSGISIWVVSNKRMCREINKFIKNNKNNVYFSKNIENILKNENDIYFKKTILDLQFNNFQNIEIELSKYIFKEFKKIVRINKLALNYASLGILSAINTPSILIETGFITNFEEEKKLRTLSYQKKIANTIYISLKNYFEHSH